MAARRPTRQIHVGSVAVGGDAQISVQSMTTTKTAEIDATLQQIATLVAAGVDIVRVAVPHKEDAAGARGDRREVHRAGRRRHPFPVEVRDGGARGRHPGLAHQPGQHQVPGQGPTDRPRGERTRRADPDRGQCGIAREGPAGALRLADPRGARRVRAERGQDPRGRGLHRHQDQREALERARDDRGVPAAGGEVRLPAAPRRHRSRAVADGRREERRRHRHAARRGDRRHDPRVPHGRSRRGGQGRQRDPAVARAPAPRPGPGGVSLVRARGGRTCSS